MRVSVAITAILFSIASLAGPTAGEAAIRRYTSIPAQRLDAALEALARERGFQILYRSDLVGQMQTAGAVGELTTQETLNKLLSGTGLTYRYLDEKAVTIVSAPSGEGAEPRAATDVDTGASLSALEEVVVTAQKKLERLQEVPIPVTVLNADDLAAKSQLLLRDYYTSIPGLVVAPDVVAAPPAAMASWEAFRAYQQEMWFPALDDMRRVEAALRQSIVIQRDGSVQDRAQKETIEALYAALWTNERRDYTRVRCPALAIYPEHLYDTNVAAPKMREAARVFEQQYWQPFQEKSIDRIQRELANVQVVRVPGSHGGFVFTERQRVVNLMREFLSAPAVRR